MISVKESIVHKFTVNHPHVPAFEGYLYIGDLTIRIEIPIKDTISYTMKDISENMKVVKERILKDGGWLARYPNPIELHIILDTYDICNKQEDRSKLTISAVDGLMARDLYESAMNSYGDDNDKFLNDLSKRITDTIW